MDREQASLSGKVTNEQGEPVAGATVMQYWDLNGQPFPGILSATTDADGRFTIDRLIANGWGGARNISFRVIHPDYPETTIQVGKLASRSGREAVSKGCTLTGTSLRPGHCKTGDNARWYDPTPRHMGRSVHAVMRLNGPISELRCQKADTTFSSLPKIDCALR